MAAEDQRPYDLEERTFHFARSVSVFIATLPRSISNVEYGRQAVRASGSVGANYIEANEGLSKKDFKMRIRICRKEAKETVYWLRLITETNAADAIRAHGSSLVNEAVQLKKIFSSILLKSN